MTERIRFDADSTAALGICESLLLALTDANVISEQDARDLLTDVATTHQAAIATAESPDKHHAVIAVVQRILAGKNGVRGHQLIGECKTDTQGRTAAGRTNGRTRKQPSPQYWPTGA